VQPETESQLQTFDEGSEQDTEESPKRTTTKQILRGFRSKGPDAGADSTGGAPAHSKSTIFGNNNSTDSRTHVGAAMRELTGQRVATGIVLALLITLMCNWREFDTTNNMTMITLHSQTANAKFAEFSVNVAHASVIPTLFSYERGDFNSTIFSETYQLSNGNDINDLRDREILSIRVSVEGSDVYTH